MLLDLDEVTSDLVKLSMVSIEAFGTKHGDKEVCAIFFDAEPEYGNVRVSLDTPSNNRESALRLQELAFEHRRRRLWSNESWQNAQHYVTTPVLSVINTNSAEFAYPEFVLAKFEDWPAVKESSDYPAEAEFCDDYLDGTFRVAVWRTVESLLKERAFATLRRADPFVVGYSIHDQEESILYIETAT